MPATGEPISLRQGVPFPWLNEAWRRLAMDRERLAHAILLSGIRGLGKNELAQEFTRALLCLHPHEGSACGQCKSCHLFAVGNHPDLSIVHPQEEGKSISIDQVRELRHFLSLTAHTSRHKVVLLSPAEAMTLSAANALLKQLEEPPAGNVLILVSHQADRLPLTVRSRCARIDLLAPAHETALAWLAEQGIPMEEADTLLRNAGDAPLQAQSMYAEGFMQEREQWMTDLAALSGGGGDPVACATRWAKQDVRVSLAWLHGFLRDLLCYRLQGASTAVLANPDLPIRLGETTMNMALGSIADLASQVTQALRLLGTGIDERLLIEDILIRWNKFNLTGN